MTWTPGDHPDGDCIEWSGRHDAAGYGIIPSDHPRGRFPIGAHRRAVEAAHGDVVIHMCDNPGCVNPEHLRIGTHSENLLDRYAKARRYEMNMRLAHLIYFEVFGTHPNEP